MSGAKSITLILFSSSLIHSSKAGGQHRLPSPRSSSVIEHRRAQPLGKQEAAMLLPVCLEKERMFSFCKFPAKRGLRHRENKEFKSFTNPSLAFRSRFLDAWTVSGLWSRDAVCEEWTNPQMGGAQGKWTIDGRCDREHPVKSPPLWQATCQTWGHILSPGEASQPRKIKFMQAPDFPLMQRSKRGDLVWANTLRHCFGEDAPEMKGVFHILGRKYQDCSASDFPFPKLFV